MYNIHTELPCGSVSRGYDRQTEDSALSTFIRVVSQVQAMKNYIIDVVLTEDGVEIQRRHIDSAT